MKAGGYLWYLQNFDHFHEINVNLKEKNFNRYKKYLNNVSVYLTDFFKRTQPLQDFSVVENQIVDDFELKWKESTIRGWEKKENIINEQHLFCQACSKYFSNENTYIHHFDGKKHKDNEKKLTENLAENLGAKNGTNPADPNNPQIGQAKESFTEEMKYDLAYKEFYVSFMRNQLCDIIQDTMNQIRKKQTRTLLENEEEKNYDDIEDEELSDSEDEEQPYNPKNLPLGWDGK
jgi:splicing factor 3A subunit 3